MIYIVTILSLLSLFSPAVYADEYDLQYIREELETVTSVSKYSQSLREVPASVTIITSDEIKNFGYRDLSDILNAVPGLYMTYDRTMSNIGVRGFGRPGDYNSRVLLLINGNPINDDIYGSVDFGFASSIDVDIISKVVVVKGPGYLYYGNNAIFAVINIITKKPYEIDGIMLSSEAGSLSTYKGIAAYAKTVRGYDILLQTSYTESEGKRDITFADRLSDGPVEESDNYWHKKFYAKIKKNRFQIQGMLTAYDKYIPTATDWTIFNSREQHIKTKRSFLELSYEGKIRSDINYTVRGFYNSFEEKFYFPYDDPDYYMWLDNPTDNRYGAEARMDWEINDRNKILIGTEVRRTGVKYKALDITDNITELDVRKDFTSYSLFGQYELRPFKGFISYLGLRYDNYGSLYSRFRSVLLPNAAMVYLPTDKDTFKLSYSEAYRTPSIFETFYIIDEPDGPYGNADLGIEKSHLINGIYERKFSDRVNLSVTLFRYWIHDLIDQQESETGGVIYENAGSTVTGTGGEAELSVKWYGGLRGNLNYSYQEVKDGSGSALLNSPLHILKGRLSLPFYSRFVLGLEGRYISKRKKSEDEWVSGYNIVNINVSAKDFYKNLDVSFGVYDLFDEKYSDPVSSEHDPIESVEQDGRTFRIKLTYTF